MAINTLQQRSRGQRVFYQPAVESLQLKYLHPDILDLQRIGALEPLLIPNGSTLLQQMVQVALPYHLLAFFPRLIGDFSSSRSGSRRVRLCRRW